MSFPWVVLTQLLLVLIRVMIYYRQIRPCYFPAFGLKLLMILLYIIREAAYLVIWIHIWVIMRILGMLLILIGTHHSKQFLRIINIM
jgi:hypothetical protein